jgi:ABC-2 type transport system ATP-binding protein
MYEVELLCDDVGIINRGLLAAFNTPQGLKDTMITERKNEKISRSSNITKIVEEMQKEASPEENASLNSVKDYVEKKNRDSMELSVMISNLDDNLLTQLENLPITYKITKQHSGRIVIDMEDSEESVTKIISGIIENNGNITSISTKDPSLEDVFVRVTAKKEEVSDDNGGN